MYLLRYGTDSSVDLDLAEKSILADFGHPPEEPLGDLRAAVAAAVGEPLEYPALAQCTTPSDRVVLALDTGSPQAAQITAAVVEALVYAQVAPDGITVLSSRDIVDSRAGNPCRLIPEPTRSRITLATHDPTDRGQMGYLGATASAEPILLNRAIHEADLVLPIGCMRDDMSAGYFGIHTTVFPTFSDERTQLRFRTVRSLDPRRNHRERLAREVDEVAWLLGVTFSVQLVPGGGNSILHVVAGRSDAVAARARSLYDAAWKRSVPQQASLVVATIEGDSSQQTWENLGRALDAAVPLVEDGGAIAVCCELAAKPGPAVQWLAGGQSRGAVLDRIRKERPADTLPAAQLARALDHAKVYLLSRLEPSIVEELDMIHVAGGKELARLTGHHPSCILLANAPFASVRVS